MVNASELYIGQVVKHEGGLFRVISSEYHSAGGQLGKIYRTRARNLTTGHVKEWHLKPEEKIENVELEKCEWEFLYQDGDLLYFMDPATFEQFPLEIDLIGQHCRYLVPNSRIQVELYEGRPVHIVFPPVILRVTSAPPGLREHEASPYKKVTLENGMQLLAPQFIKEGEYIRVDAETGKYLERVHV